jgi:predicted DNA-binding protein (UPF0251 family)
MQRNRPIADSEPTPRQIEVARAVEATGGNFAAAAKALGIGKSAVRQTMVVYRTKQAKALTPAPQ